MLQASALSIVIVGLALAACVRAQHQIWSQQQNPTGQALQQSGLHYLQKYDPLTAPSQQGQLAQALQQSGGDSTPLGAVADLSNQLSRLNAQLAAASRQLHHYQEQLAQIRQVVPQLRQQQQAQEPQQFAPQPQPQIQLQQQEQPRLQVQLGPSADRSSANTVLDDVTLLGLSAHRQPMNAPQRVFFRQEEPDQAFAAEVSQPMAELERQPQLQAQQAFAQQQAAAAAAQAQAQVQLQHQPRNLQPQPQTLVEEHSAPQQAAQLNQQQPQPQPTPQQHAPSSLTLDSQAKSQFDTATDGRQAPAAPTANDDKFSIGLGVLSPGYTQKFLNSKLDFNQDKDGYSFTLSNNGHSNAPQQIAPRAP